MSRKLIVERKQLPQRERGELKPASCQHCFRLFKVHVIQIHELICEANPKSPAFSLGLNPKKRFIRRRAENKLKAPELAVATIYTDGGKHPILKDDAFMLLRRGLVKRVGDFSLSEFETVDEKMDQQDFDYVLSLIDKAKQSGANLWPQSRGTRRR